VQALRRARHRRGKSQRAPKSLRKDGVLGVRGIITFSHEAQPVVDGLTTEEQDTLYRKAADAIAREFNTSVVGLTVHADEQAPHAHFVLPGYDNAGRPLSERMEAAVYSHLQDVVGAVYNEVGIERGIKKVDRVKAREPDSKTLHRSVKQLHADLPAEIEAAREHAQERIAAARQQADEAKADAATAEAERDRAHEQADAAKTDAIAAETERDQVREQAREAEAQLEALKAKITKNERLEARARERAEKAEADSNERAAKARKNEQTYRKRAQKARAQYEELRQDLPLPEPTTEQVVTRDRGPLQRQETESREVYPAETIEHYTAHTDRLRHKTEATNRELRKRVQALVDGAAQWQRAGSGEQSEWTPEKALAARQEHRYGVICSTQENEIAVPHQRATAKQVAAAIYQYGREQGWPSLVLSAVSRVEREVLRMAQEDGRLEWVQGVSEEVWRDFAPAPDITSETIPDEGAPLVHRDDHEPPTAGMFT
jgi:hypothetical protein